MEIAGTSIWIIIAAAVAAFIFGGVYYGVLSKPWMAAARLSPDKTGMSPSLLATTLALELMMAIGMAWIINMGGGGAGAAGGMVTGALLWAVVIAPVTAINQRYEGFGWNLTLIDTAHWLGAAVIMGAIIGWSHG